MNDLSIHLPTPLQWMGAFAGALVAILVLDAIWLGVLARPFVLRELGPLMLERPRFGVAALFYALYAVGICYFAIRPAMAGGAWSDAAITGVLLGLFAYLTYDLTNLATLRGWSVAFAVVDVAWGGFLTGVAAIAGYHAAHAVR